MLHGYHTVLVRTTVARIHVRRAMTENRQRLYGKSYGGLVGAGERAGRLAGGRAGVSVTFGCCGRDIRKAGVER